MDDAARRVHDRGMNKPVIPPAETTSHTMASYRATGWEGDSGARRFMPALVIVVLVAVGGVAIEFALSDQPKLNEAAAREPAVVAAPSVTEPIELAPAAPPSALAEPAVAPKPAAETPRFATPPRSVARAPAVAPSLAARASPERQLELAPPAAGVASPQPEQAPRATDAPLAEPPLLAPIGNPMPVPTAASGAGD